MIKTIIFDNHGVLTTGDAEEGYDKIADFLGVSVDVLEPVWQGDLSCDLDDGKITTDGFLEGVMKEVGVSKDLNEFRKIYSERYVPKEDVREFAKDLKKHFEIVLLTNAGDFFDEYNKRWKMEEVFDENKIFVSEKLKMIKPNEDIYKYVLNKIEKKSEETVFIDDNEEFIATAKRLGMHTIHFKSLDQVEKELENILEYDYV